MFVPIALDCFRVQMVKVIVGHNVGINFQLVRLDRDRKRARELGVDLPGGITQIRIDSNNGPAGFHYVPGLPQEPQGGLIGADLKIKDSSHIQFFPTLVRTSLEAVLQPKGHTAYCSASIGVYYLETTFR
jgi:hypothetical protein